MIERKDEIEKIGARVLLVAYDKPSLLGAKMMRGLETPYELLLDVKKEAYRRWGLGRTTLRQSVLSPTLGLRYVKLLLRGERFLGFAPDMLQLGGDFSVDREGRIAFAYAMRDNGDRVAVPELIAHLIQAATV